MAESYSSICMYYIFFINLPIIGRLGCFYLLAILNNAAVSMEIQISLIFIALVGLTITNR